MSRLQRQHGEVVQGIGVGNRGQLVTELFVSDTGSWTVLVTRTNGTSCIAASGRDWTPVDGTIPPEEEPA